MICCQTWTAHKKPWAPPSLTVCLVGVRVSWVGSNLVFEDGANSKEYLVALRFWGQTQPVLVFG